LQNLEGDLAEPFIKTPLCQGAFYGERTRRFGGLLARSPLMQQLVMHPLILAVVEQMLLPWCERIALNLTQAIEIHPGALPQLPHRDQDMWAGPKGSIEYLVNVMWPLVPFSPENGGTRLWSGSHNDQDVALLSEEDAVVPSMSVGDALLFLGSTLHGGGGNRSAAPRCGIVVSYCLGWLKPFELQWLVYPPAIARHFSPELAALVGYAQHRPNLGNVEGQCPSVLLRDEVPAFLPAIDALRPDQAEATEMFVRNQMQELG
jgi:ectoine hydroxylase-related dioxygenase (phytanoyl-CoA dioxygenase family)